MSEVMKLALTVVGGYIVFSISQFTLKYIIEPIIFQKKIIGDALGLIIQYKLK